MAKIRLKEESTTHEYTVFVNGKKLMSPTRIYDWAYQRGLALAIWFGLDFQNTRSDLITDKWTGNGNMIIIQRSKIKVEEELVY